MPLDEPPDFPPEQIEEAKQQFQRAKEIAAELAALVIDKTGHNPRMISMVTAIVQSSVLRTVFDGKSDGSLDRGLAACVISTVRETIEPCCNDPTHLLAHCFCVLSTVFTDEMVLNALARTFSAVRNELVEKGFDGQNIIQAFNEYMERDGAGVLRKVEVDDAETKH